MFHSRRTVPARSCLLPASLLLMLLAVPASGVEDSWPDAPRAGKPAGASENPVSGLPPDKTTPPVGPPGNGTSEGTATQGSTGRPPAAAPATATGKGAAGRPDPAREGEPPTRQPGAGETPLDESAEGSSQAADTPPAPPRNPPLRMETRRNRDLARELERQGGRRGQALWVGEGQEPFLAVLTPQEGLKVKGGLILLHDQAQHPDWPGILHALRTRLPASGWMTLSVAVPDFIPPPDRRAGQKAPPAAATEQGAELEDTDSDEDGEMAASEDADADTLESGKRVVIPAGRNGEFLQRQAEFPPDEYQQEVRSRIEQAIERLESEQDMPIALAAVGQTAGLVSGLLAMAPDERLDAVVLVEPEAFPQEGFRLAEDVGQLEIPVLDIINDELDEGAAAWRKQEAGRNANSRYEQRRIMSADRDFEGFETSVAKSVSGWMARRVLKAPTPAAGDKTTGAPSGTSSPATMLTGTQAQGNGATVDAGQTGLPGVTTATVVPGGLQAGTATATPTGQPATTTPVTPPVVTGSPVPPPPVPGNPRLVAPNLQEPVPVPPPVPSPTP